MNLHIARANMSFNLLSLQTAAEWRTVFWLTFLFYIAGAVVFVTLMRAERQEWDKVEGLSKEPTSDTAVTPR